MKNSTKQVVILDNFSSPYIHQAILILKDYDPALEDKVIEEAEKIVSKFLNRPHIIEKRRKRKIPWSFLTATAIVAAIILSYIITAGR